MELTDAFGSGSKPMSREPSLLSRAAQLRVVAALTRWLKLREPAADDDLSIGLDGDCQDRLVRIGVERGVKGPVSVEPSDAIAGRRAGGAVGLHGREGAADHDLAVGLHRDGVDNAVHAGLNAESSVPSAFSRAT